MSKFISFWKKDIVSCSETINFNKKRLNMSGFIVALAVIGCIVLFGIPTFVIWRHNRAMIASLEDDMAQTPEVPSAEEPTVEMDITPVNDKEPTVLGDVSSTNVTIQADGGVKVSVKASKKPAPKKTPVKKVTPKKPAPKKVAPKKEAPKVVKPKKEPAKKTVTKKAPLKKAAPKSAPAKTKAKK